jgi:hypothetical protein
MSGTEVVIRLLIGVGTVPISISLFIVDKIHPDVILQKDGCKWDEICEEVGSLFKSVSFKISLIRASLDGAKIIVTPGGIVYNPLRDATVEKIINALTSAAPNACRVFPVHDKIHIA